MRKGSIRPLSICLFQYKKRILVTEYYDEKSGSYYYRPIGGGIEYGETSLTTLVREVREEIRAEIKNPEYLGIIENIFTYNGNLGHEIVFVYDAYFLDPSFYDNNFIKAREDYWNSFQVKWIPVNDFLKGNKRLVPDGLVDLIQNCMDEQGTHKAEGK